MPDSYSASVNPPRRAKRPPIIESPPSTASSTSETSHMRPYTPRATTAAEPAEPPPPPAKRGRKPGPLSKSAREAQRRLNHSIIEKARRTKINDALASLRQLVPVDYGQKKAQPEPQEEDVDDTDDEEGDEPPQDKAPSKGKGKGKKEEKEKEFKLEILVRTVAFLQDLLQRVATLEAAASAPAPAHAPCQNCTTTKPPRKRKHMHVDDDDDADHRPDNTVEPQRSAKIPRHVGNSAPPPESLPRSGRNSAQTSPSLDPQLDPPSRGHSLQQQQLPPISSWLHPKHDPIIDPQLLPGGSTSSRPRLRADSTSSSSRPSPHLSAYLPSPPGSTHVDATRATHMPPHLSLGPVATAAIVNPPLLPSNVRGSRTPEDETAASLLLQISASSPPFRPARSSANEGKGIARGGLLDPSAFLLHGPSDGERSRSLFQRHERSDGDVRQAQTPGSMLGLHKTKY